MANLLKSFAEMLAAGQNPIANTQVAETGVLDNASQVLKSVLDTATDVTNAPPNTIPKFLEDKDIPVVFRVNQTTLSYQENGKSKTVNIPAGTKIVKIAEEKNKVTVLVWLNDKHYIGKIDLEKINQSKTQNIINPKGFLNDAKHTHYRLIQRLTSLGHANTSFAERMVVPISLAIKQFEELSNSEAEARLRNALELHKKLDSIQDNKVIRVQKVLEAIFSVNDFPINGINYSEQILVMPITIEWIKKYTANVDTNIQTLNGTLTGGSGEGVNVFYNYWDIYINTVKELTSLIATNEEAINTLEGKWLIDVFIPMIDNNTIKQVVFLGEDTWNYAFNVAYADYIPIREVHGPFFTPPLFTIMTHEINVNQFQGNLFIPADTHASDEVIKKAFDEITTLTVPNDIDSIDALYQSHAYLSSICLKYIFKLIF